jgi:hypothetical protein
VSWNSVRQLNKEPRAGDLWHWKDYNGSHHDMLTTGVSKDGVFMKDTTDHRMNGLGHMFFRWADIVELMNNERLRLLSDKVSG